MNDVAGIADPEDDPEEYEEIIQDQVDMLSAASSALSKIAGFHEEAVEQCDTMIEASQYVQKCMTEELHEDEQKALEELP